MARASSPSGTLLFALAPPQSPTILLRVDSSWMGAPPMMLLTRRQALAGLAAASLPALAGCQVAPGTGKEGLNFYSAEEEVKLGGGEHPKLLKEFGGAYDDPGLQAYVAGIGQRLVRQTETPQAEFRFTVLNSDIVNAMALPGGFIYISRGLLGLVGNEAELAGVLGHEIGHVMARHSTQRLSQAQAANLFLGVLGAVVGVPGVADIASMGVGAYLQSYSRENEFEADSLGARYISRAGYDTDAVVHMLSKLREHSQLEARMAGRSPDTVDEFHFMSTHPRTIDRVQAAIETAKQGPDKGVFGQEQFLAATDGVIYGDDPAQGVVRGRSFLHPDLGLRFEVPTGFRVTNGSKAVVARNPQGAVIRFDGAQAGRHSDMVSIIQSWAGRNRLSGAEELQINGMRAATGAFSGQTKDGKQVDVRLVGIRFVDEASLYRFMFITPRNLTAQLGEDLRRTTYSFRPLSREERANIQPLRLKTITAKAGDTVEALAERMPVEGFKAEQFRLLNGLQPGETLPPGRKLRTIV